MSEPHQSPRRVWDEVGDRFDELGRAVRGHLAATPPPPAEPAAEPAGPDGSARDAVRDLGRTAQRWGAQAGAVARDPEVRESAQRATRTLGDAVASSVEGFAGELRARMRSPRWSDPDRPRPTEPPPVTLVRDHDEPPTP